MRNYKINIKKNNFPEVLGSRKMQNQKTSRKPKKQKKQKKTIFQRSWKWKRLGKRLKILFFLVFLFFGFSKVFWLFSKGPSPKSFQILFFLVFLFFCFSKVFWLFSKGPSPKSLRILMLLAYPPLDFVFLWITLPSLYTSFIIIFVS